MKKLLTAMAAWFIQSAESGRLQKIDDAVVWLFSDRLSYYTSQNLVQPVIFASSTPHYLLVASS